MIISQFTLDELTERICERLKPEFKSIVTPEPPQEEELLTSKQSAKLLRISLPTLHKWKTEGRIKFYRMASRIRFKRSELLQTLQAIEKTKGC